MKLNLIKERYLNTTKEKKERYLRRIIKLWIKDILINVFPNNNKSFSIDKLNNIFLNVFNVLIDKREFYTFRISF